MGKKKSTVNSFIPGNFPGRILFLSRQESAPRLRSLVNCSWMSCSSCSRCEASKPQGSCLILFKDCMTRAMCMGNSWANNAERRWHKPSIMHNRRRSDMSGSCLTMCMGTVNMLIPGNFPGRIFFFPDKNLRPD